MKKLTKEEIEEELKRCRYGFENMTGEEYFYYHYCRIDGKLPEMGTWSPGAVKKYKQYAKSRRSTSSYHAIKSIQEHLMTLKESFIYLDEDGPYRNKSPFIDDNRNPRPEEPSMKGIFHQMRDSPVTHIDISKEEYAVDFDAILKSLQKSETERRKNPRGFMAWIGCRTRGLIQVDMSSVWYCNDESCETCSSFKKLIEKEINKK